MQHNMFTYCVLVSVLTVGAMADVITLAKTRALLSKELLAAVKSMLHAQQQGCCLLMQKEYEPTNVACSAMLLKFRQVEGEGTYHGLCRMGCNCLGCGRLLDL